jgi:hypothetical protein
MRESLKTLPHHLKHSLFYFFKETHMSEIQTKMWARNNGGSLEILSFDPNGKWADGNPFVAVPAELEHFVDSSYSVDEAGAIVPPSLDYLRNQIMMKIAAQRFTIETGGVTFLDGSVIKTDRESQAQLSSAFSSLINGLITSTPWKVGPGQFVPVTLEMIRPIAQLVADHVSTCFAIEAAKCQELTLLDTVEGLLTYSVTAGWDAVRPAPTPAAQ